MIENYGVKDKWALEVDNGGNEIINSSNHLFESSQLFLIKTTS